MLADTLADMIQEGIIMYGWEIEGKWWECGDKKNWLFSNLHFALKHPLYGKEMQKFLKEEKLI